MGTQLTLPAGWASNYVSMPDPGERLDALKQAQLDTKAEVRILFDRLADRFGVQTREVDRAMDSLDDTISDLVYEIESDLEQEIDDRQERD